MIVLDEEMSKRGVFASRFGDRDLVLVACEVAGSIPMRVQKLA